MSVVGTLGFLLPTIAFMMKGGLEHFDFPTLFLRSNTPSLGFELFQHEKLNLKYFRILWILIVIYKFTDPDESQVFGDWFAAVLAIAARTPTLVMMSDPVLFQTQLESHFNMKFDSAEVVSFVNSSFLKLLPEVDLLKESLSIPKRIYILSVLHLERLRARSGVFFAIFQYLENQSLKQSGLSPFLDAVADKVFQEYLKSFDSSVLFDSDGLRKRKSRSRRTNIINHAIFLLVKSSSRYSNVALKARKYLESLVSRFAFIQWDRLCLGVIFELLQYLDEKKGQVDFLETSLRNDVIHLSLLTPSGLSTEPIVIDLPESVAARKALFKDYIMILTKWIENAAFDVPSEIVSSVQQYLQLYLIRDSALDFTPPYSPILGVSSRLNLDSFWSESKSAISVFSSPVTNLGLGVKQQCLGYITSYYNAYCSGWISSRDGLGFGKWFTKTLQSEFHSISIDVKRDSSLLNERVSRNSFDSRIRELVCKAAALFAWSHEMSHVSAEDREIDRKELMFILCNAPITVFSGSSIQAAVFCWRWMITLSSELALYLLVNMKSAWSSTIESKKGLFSQSNPDCVLKGEMPGMVFSAKHPKETPAVKASTIPHKLWIEFLDDSFEVIKNLQRGCLRAFASMINSSLANPSAITVTPSSFAPRFRLLLVGLKVVQSKSFKSIELVELLRDRIYAAAFAWFCEAPRWLAAGTRKEVEDDAGLIIQICKLLQKERKDSSVPVDHGPGSDTSSLRSSQAHADLRKGSKRFSSSGSSFDTSSQDWAWRSAKSHIPALTNVPEELHTFLISVKSSEGTEKRSVGSTTVTGGGDSRKMSSTTDVLMFLMTHELHRFVAWHNPKKLKRLNFPDQDLFLDLFNLNSDLFWERLFQLSWNITSKLTYRIARRFPSVNVFQNLLRNRVAIEPWSLHEIGDSVTYLVTSTAALQNSPQLLWLAYYQPCSFTTALKFLKHPFSHNQIVCEYAMRSIASHGTETMIFYLNQILQALRYDVFGFLKDFLLRACNLSPFLAHKLIWACQTESICDSEKIRGSGLDPKLDPIPKICIKLERDIVKNFSESDKAFYDEEFSFIDSLTKFSLDLLEIPKTDKPRRNAELRKKLADCDIQSSRLYLPTDHTADVITVIPESGITLQSAAKVPFLAAFKVRKRGYIRESSEEFEKHLSPAAEQKDYDLEKEEDDDDSKLEIEVMCLDFHL